MRYANYYSSSGLYHVSLPLLMGTRLDALLFGDDEQSLTALWTDIETDFRRLEKMLSRFDSESETTKVNNEAQFSSVELSDELWNIMLDCRKYYELTDGCFDVTRSNFGKIVFMENSRSIQFDEYGLSLDFGGYAKGYALKRAQKSLAEAGTERAIVIFGNSSTLAVGAHPYGDSWPIGVEDPYSGAMITTINLRDTSLSVSGGAPSRPQHIVNPASGAFAASEKMVAVVADNPVDSDVLTTAWLASGSENAPAWMDKFENKTTYKLK